MTNSVNNAIMYIKEGLIMPDEIFSGIPSLDDEQGLEALINQQNLEAMGLDSNTPAALDQPAQEPQPDANNAPQYTSEQIAGIIARNQQLEAQLNQRQVQQPQQVQMQQRQNVSPVYSDRQIAIINELLRRGVPMERIAQITSKQSAEAATLQRIQALEQHIQQEQYNREAEAFEQKMLAFGDKFGLSEKELVHFGNVAASKGINVATVTDLEAVFSGIFPEQYALRRERMSNRPTSQIYGGANIGEAPRAAANKMEDAYVEAFLAKSMPNQYGMYSKK